MIKHEEVREIVIWGRIIHQDTEKARETLLDYIAEQEKKDLSFTPRFVEICAVNNRPEYECGNCGTPLEQYNLVSSEMFFCPQCGKEINWENAYEPKREMK